MDWLWHNFGLISQKAPLDFQLGKMAELEAKSKLDLKSLSLSIPAKAFLASQLPFALKQPNVPRFEVFSDETLQNIIKVLLYIDYMEDAYFSSLEDYPVNPLTKFSGSVEDIIKRPWVEFLSNPEDPDEPLRTRAGLLEYLISSYGNTGTNDDAINKLVQGIFNSNNWFMLSDEDLAKFHQGWQVELPQELTYVAIVTLQNAIIGELLVSSYYNSDKTVGYFRELYDQSEDIVSFWENSN